MLSSREITLSTTMVAILPAWLNTIDQSINFQSGRAAERHRGSSGSGPSSQDAEAVGTFLACCGRVDAIAALAAEPEHLSDDIVDADEVPFSV